MNLVTAPPPTAVPDAEPRPPSVFAAVDPVLPDPALTLDELGSRIVALSGRLAAATCRWLLLVAEFDARDGAHNLGIVSTARWLEYACGIAHRTAVEQVRIGRSLRAWPQLADELAAGRLSYSHARAISRIATGGRDPGEDDASGEDGAGAVVELATPELVEGLIVSARHGTVAQLEVLVRGLRSVNDNETSPTETAEQERVTQSWTLGSQWRLSARLDPERGALVQAALAAAAEPEGLSAADALVRLAEITIGALADRSARSLRGEEQAAIVVHLNAADVPAAPGTGAATHTATGPDTDPGTDNPDGGVDEDDARSRERGVGSTRVRPFGRLENGPGLPAAVIERLACGGRVRLVLRDGGNPHSDVLDLGRTHRLVTTRQYRALQLRDGHRCAHPGCAGRRNLEAHHVRHWLHGGRTDLDNLTLLCRAHHLAHHDGDFQITALGRGRFRFLRGGKEQPHTVDPGVLDPDPASGETDYAAVGPQTAQPLWDGSRLQRNYAIDALAQHLRVLRSA